MNWLIDFYKRRKNPWIGFVLVLLFGPFGFLYHSWKTTLGVLFIVGPLWIVFLRHTRFDLIENLWAHYVALFVLAAFASLQIRGQQNKLGQLMVKRTQGTEIVDAVLSLLPDENTKNGFAVFLSEHPSLSTKLQMNTALLHRPEEPEVPFVRWRIAGLVASYGTMLGDAGDFPGATTSFLYSMKFLENNPVALFGMAEVYMAWEDRIAARWAQRALDFCPGKSPSEILNKVYSDTTVLSSFHDMNERMRHIIKVCSEHPEWRDSYPLKKPAGLWP